MQTNTRKSEPAKNRKRADATYLLKCGLLEERLLYRRCARVRGRVTVAKIGQKLAYNEVSIIYSRYDQRGNVLLRVRKMYSTCNGTLDAYNLGTDIALAKQKQS